VHEQIFKKMQEHPTVEKRIKPSSCKNVRKSGSGIQIQLELVDDESSELSNFEGEMMQRISPLSE